MKNLQGLTVEQLETRREMASLTIAQEKCPGYKCGVLVGKVGTTTITVTGGGTTNPPL